MAPGKSDDLWFLVSADPTFCFADHAPISEGYGAFLFAAHDPDSATRLANDLNETAKERAFRVVVMHGSTLTLEQQGLALEEMWRSIEVGNDNDNAEDSFDSAVVIEIGRAAVQLRKMHAERVDALIISAEVQSLTESGVFYLRASYDEYLTVPFDHDAFICDPSELVVDSGSIVFFEVNGRSIAEQLVQLFDYEVKPRIDSDGDTRFRVLFWFQPVEDFNDIELFVIREKLEQARDAAEKQHLAWRTEQGLLIENGAVVAGRELLEQLPPLENDSLLPATLYDQAARWHEKLVRHGLSSAKRTLAPTTESSGPNSVETAASNQGARSRSSKTFSGGTMEFFGASVVLNAVDICSGPRSAKKRLLLQALCEQHADGRFVTYSCKKLAPFLNLRPDAVPGAIRTVQKSISTTLWKEKGISCGLGDVIQNKGKGYCFSDRIIVQIDNTAAGLTDTEKNVRDVRNDDVRDVGNVRTNDEPTRREWILIRLKGREKVRAVDVAIRFKVSVKTAERDFKALVTEEQVEFKGPKCTGRYHLTDKGKTTAHQAVSRTTRDATTVSAVGDNATST
jgi:hypothetical protein